MSLSNVGRTVLLDERPGVRGASGLSNRRAAEPPDRRAAGTHFDGGARASVPCGRKASAHLPAHRGRLAPDRDGSRTFPYRFGKMHPEAHCHGLCVSGTPNARWGRRWGAGSVDGQTTQGRPTGSGEVVARFLASLQNCLEPGGAVATPLVAFRSEWECVDCQVPSRNWCLPLRDGAAGPERSVAPRPCTLALGQWLEQSIALHFSRLEHVQPLGSEPPISLHLGVCGGVRATRAASSTFLTRARPGPFTFETPGGYRPGQRQPRTTVTGVRP